MGRREFISVCSRLGKLLILSLPVGVSYCAKRQIVTEEGIIVSLDVLTEILDEIDEENPKEMTPEERKKRRKEMFDILKELLESKDYEVGQERER